MDGVDGDGGVGGKQSGDGTGSGLGVGNDERAGDDVRAGAGSRAGRRSGAVTPAADGDNVDGDGSDPGTSAAFARVEDCGLVSWRTAGVFERQSAATLLICRSADPVPAGL